MLFDFLDFPNDIWFDDIPYKYKFEKNVDEMLNNIVAVCKISSPDKYYIKSGILSSYIQPNEQTSVLTQYFYGFMFC